MSKNTNNRESAEAKLVAAEEEIDRLRMASTADGGFRFQWCDRAITAEEENCKLRAKIMDELHDHAITSGQLRRVEDELAVFYSFRK